MDDGIYEDDYTYYYDEEEDINKTSHDDDPALAIVPEDELKFISINDTVDELTAPLVNFSMKSVGVNASSQKCSIHHIFLTAINGGNCSIMQFGEMFDAIF